ncbi:hypothetical protein DEO72_LG10g1599 [Vigna unguiculata]|uniref:Uncharacterized protein n=1 Tax=Vigna unguiculata TaxID=3917 RepID=A0A4D6NCW7_VIGUN|nr:hypothetical protein DEO72_LG10g1599 [Vigna unguiculata]
MAALSSAIASAAKPFSSKFHTHSVPFPVFVFPPTTLTSARAPRRANSHSRVSESSSLQRESKWCPRWPSPSPSATPIASSCLWPSEACLRERDFRRSSRLKRSERELRGRTSQERRWGSATAVTKVKAGRRW